MLDAVRLLVGYTEWADGRMLDAAAKLSPEAWTRDLSSSHRSVRDTVVHLIGAQWIWLSRWKGTSPPALWNPADYPTLDSVSARWRDVWREIADFLALQTDASLAQPLTYANLQGKTLTFPLGPLMLHFANHSTYHRGQVATLLRQLGAEPAATDLFLYMAERR